MKLRDIVYMLGFRPTPKSYGWDLERIELPREGCIEFAQWRHPRQNRTEFTQAALDELRSFLRPGDFAIDVGAQVGDSTVPIAFAVGRTGAVLALEPNRYVYAVLEANAELNQHRTNIVPHCAAAGNAAGELVFEYSDAGYCNGGRHDEISRWRHGHLFPLKVDCIRLEELVRREHAARLPRLKYIKTDTEGADLEVLRSIAGLIEEARPYLKVEVYRHLSPAHRAELFTFLHERGYRIHHAQSERCLRGKVLQLADTQHLSHYDIFCVPQGAR